MIESLFFVLGIINNAALIAIFIIRTYRFSLLYRIGRFYLVLAIPAIFGLFLVVHEQGDMRYAIFLAIFFAFVVLEGIYDFLLKLPFRQNWKLLIPYLCLYYATAYGFIVMNWRISVLWGVAMLVLTIVQIAVNVATHSRN